MVIYQFIYWLEVLIISIFVDILITLITVKLSKYFKVSQVTFAAISPSGTKVREIIQSLSSIMLTVSDVLVVYIEKSVYPQMINNNIFYVACCILLIIDEFYIILIIPQMFTFRKEQSRS